MIEYDNQHQCAVVWEKEGVDMYNRDTYGQPRQIRCRWEERYDQVKLDSGELVNTTARIMVSEKIPLESVIKLGTLKDLETPLDDLHEVVMVRSVPSLDGLYTQRTVVTQRFVGHSPTL